MNSLKAGDVVFDVRVRGLNRDEIRVFSESTEDPNPIHLDQQFAEECGFPTVIQQGTVTSAHLVRLFSERFGPENLKTFDISLTAPVFPEEDLQLHAVVDAVDSKTTISFTATKLDGTTTAKGYFQVSGSD